MWLQPGRRLAPLYFKDVSTLLLEIVGTTMASIPLTFGAVMVGLFKYGIDLNMLIRKPGVCPSRIIYEAERLNPNLDQFECGTARQIQNCRAAPGSRKASGSYA